MRKKRLSIAIIMVAVLSAWSDNELSETDFNAERPNGCKGYTILEYGKGINCRGDTVSLERRGGLQVLAFANKGIENRYQ